MLYVHSVYDELLEIHRPRNAGFEKNQKTNIGFLSAEIAEDKLIKRKPSSTEISRSFVWAFKNRITSL